MDSQGTIRSGFWNFSFRNRVVYEMLGAAYSLSKKFLVEIFCDIYKIWNFWTKFRFFQGQVWLDLWPRMAKVCYYCKLNNMLMCEIM